MASWTKGHFETIAKIIKEDVEDSRLKNRLCTRFADEIGSENPLFKKQLFLDVCLGRKK